MITSGPEDMPVTIPVVAPTEAIPGELLDQVPPERPSPRLMTEPIHNPVMPVIGAGAALTVATAVTKQPAGAVYVIMAVPDDRPLTTPVLRPMGATDGLLLVHVPPVTALL